MFSRVFYANYMDELEKYVSYNLLSKKNILNLVDDYSLYSYYIGDELELRTKYSSPLREGDNDPSFSLFFSKYKENLIMFKDGALGKSGNVFDFLELYLGLTSRQVQLQVNSDLSLGLDGDEVADFKPAILKKRPIKKFPAKIFINRNNPETPEYLEYWERLDISKSTRDKFYASDVRVVHYSSDKTVTIVPRTLTIAYEILGTYKIYHPFEAKKFKFRNNFPSNYVEGAMQLDFKLDFVIITKANKECMFFDEHFSWDAVAGKSETTPIPEEFIENILRKNYKKIFVWLDNDATGVTSQAAYLEKYPDFIPIEFGKEIEDKDPTDYYDTMKVRGKQQEALKYIKNLIYGTKRN